MPWILAGLTIFGLALLGFGPRLAASLIALGIALLILSKVSDSLSSSDDD